MVLYQSQYAFGTCEMSRPYCIEPRLLASKHRYAIGHVSIAVVEKRSAQSTQALFTAQVKLTDVALPVQFEHMVLTSPHGRKVARHSLEAL